MDSTARHPASPAKVHDRDGVQLWHGDADDVLSGIADDSVDLVLTDPPYLKVNEWVWELLGRQSARVLKPGGSLVTLFGHFQVPEVTAELGRHLRYWWLCGMRHGGSVNRLPGKWVAVAWKPALWYVKDHRRGTNSPVDMYEGGGRDKRFHEWGQPAGWFGHWIERLTDAGDVVVDPFAGGGTTLAAAATLGRRAVGAEIDAEDCGKAVTRLSQGLLLLPQDNRPRTEQASLLADG